MFGIHRIYRSSMGGIMISMLLLFLNFQVQAQPSGELLKMLQEARELSLQLTRTLNDWKVKDAKNRQKIEGIEEEVNAAKLEIIDLIRNFNIKSRGGNDHNIEAATLKILVETLAAEIARLRKVAAERPDYNFEKAQGEAKLEEIKRKMKALERQVEELKRENEELRGRILGK